MKYQVQIKFTNPSHEHVSLRRRVDTITRVVEAANEAEALNRAANQQRALGFLIKEAEVYAPVNGLHSLALNNNEPQKGKEKKKKLVGDDNEVTDVGASKGVKEAAGTASYPLLKPGQKIKPMKLKMGEGFDPDPKDIAAHLVDKHGKGKVTKDHVDAYERDRDSNKAIDKEAVMKHVEKMSEEVEQLREGPSHYQYSGTIHSNVGNAKHGEEKDDGHSYSITIPTRGAHQGDLGSFLSSKKAFSRISRENPHLEPHHVLAIMHGTGDDVEDVEVDHKGKTYKHRLYNTQEPDYLYEEVELDEAQRKLKPSYWKAEWRLGTQSEVDKNNKKIYDRLAKTDPDKAKKFHDNLMKIRKEEVEQVEEGAATAQKVMDRANVVAKTNPDPKKRFAAGGLANKAMMRTINPTGVNTGIVRGGGNKAYRKITGKAPPHQLTKKTGVSEEVVTEASKEGKDVMRGMRASLKSMDLRHGVDSDKREAGYKMSPAVRAAQAKSDALSKVVKRPQAGTLAAAKMKKEAAENNGKQKARKAAEKMVNRAKSKANKIDVEPSIEPGKPNA